MGYESGTAKLTRRPLFTRDTPIDQIFSDWVEVDIGSALLFTAYNLPEEGEIFFNWVSKGSYDSVNHGHNCGQPQFVGRPAADLFRIRMTLGGADHWKLTGLQPQRLVTLPGVYRLELGSEDLLGQELHVEYNKWFTTNNLPLVL
jgi:hypothetical protein